VFLEFFQHIPTVNRFANYAYVISQRSNPFQAFPYQGMVVCNDYLFLGRFHRVVSSFFLRSLCYFFAVRARNNAGVVSVRFKRGGSVFSGLLGAFDWEHYANNRYDGGIGLRLKNL
jgi:hypothetical protein